MCTSEGSNDMDKIVTESMIQTHINMAQGIIKRHAGNSASCKQWCITIIAAVATIYYSKGESSINMNILFWVVGLFYFLDCFYLGLERAHINRLSAFTELIKKGSEDEIRKEIFKVGNKYSKISGCSRINKLVGQAFGTLGGMVSFSTTPFYLVCFVWVCYMTGITLCDIGCK